MKLDQFVTQTLISVLSGIKNASKEAFENKLSQNSNSFLMASVGKDMDEGKYINFDVAVTTSSQLSGDIEGTGDILVASLNANLSAKQNHENVSRVKFKVYCNG